MRTLVSTRSPPGTPPQGWALGVTPFVERRVFHCLMDHTLPLSVRRQIVLEVTVGSESFLITADRTLRELDQALRRLDGVRAAAVKFAFAGTNRTALCNPHIDPEEPTRIMPSVTVALADVNHTSRCNPAVASPECRNRLRGLNGLAVANADDLKDYVIDFDVLAAPDPPAFAVRVHENT
ncbi:MAG: hypothetical protein ACK4L4_19955, partial [Gemmobacter sp.]